MFIKGSSKLGKVLARNAIEKRFYLIEIKRKEREKEVGERELENNRAILTYIDTFIIYKNKLSKKQ